MFLTISESALLEKKMIQSIFELSYLAGSKSFYDLFSGKFSFVSGYFASKSLLGTFYRLLTHFSINVPFQIWISSKLAGNS